MDDLVWSNIVTQLKAAWESIQSFSFNPMSVLGYLFPFSPKLIAEVTTIFTVCTVLRIWSMFHGNQ